MRECCADEYIKIKGVYMIPVKEKEAVLTLYQQGQKYGEIAELLSLSPNTVKSICRRSGIKRIQPDGSVPGFCQNCGTPLSYASGAKHKRFCSDQCRYAWWNCRRGQYPYQLICCCCGQKFISYGNKNRKYCGRECYLRSRYGEGLP